MSNRISIIFLSVSLFCYSTIKAQDTLVGWTFPEGTKNAIANIGNELNKGGMFIEADSINEIPFTPSISFAFNGYLTKSASAVLWDHAKDLKCWKFSCDATGYKNLKIYARVSSDSNNPGPRDFKIQYRLGCCSPIWYDVPGAAPFTVSTNWTTGFVNGIEIPEDADSMSGFQVRFVCTSDTATDGSILKTTSRSLIDEVYVTGDNMTSVFENISNQTIVIYPNPSTGMVNILTDTKSKEIIIYNSFGQQIFYDKVSAKINIDLTEFGKGMYIVKLQNNSVILTKKLIIQ